MPHAEAGVVRTLLDRGSALRGLSTRRIAAEAFTTPATLVRLGQRLGYEGWADFFEAFLEEREYLDRHFQKIDANRPFEAGDSQTVISNKIAALHQESIQDTLALLLSAAQEDCAIVVSYSGTTQRIVESVEILHQNGVPTILLTGLGQNPLRAMADCVLHMTTRERLSSKIANFTTEVSAQLLLDILYACYFAAHYDQNWDKRLQMTRQAELYRHTDNQIMKE